LAPFFYTRLPLALASGVLIFGEVPDIAALAGCAAIVLACILSSVR
jgi:drug/metabolite transporter (DMT)-like permease